MVSMPASASWPRRPRHSRATMLPLSRCTCAIRLSSLTMNTVPVRRSLQNSRTIAMMRRNGIISCDMATLLQSGLLAQAVHGQADAQAEPVEGARQCADLVAAAGLRD